MKKFQYDVFLSHSSADKEIVRDVATKLKEAGLNVWFDEWVIAVGDDIYLSIESGLEKSRVLILFISSNALTSDWVVLERGTALFRDPTSKTRRFIPILIDHCDMPDTLRRYRYLDFRQVQDQDKKIIELIEVCRKSISQSGWEDDEDTITKYRKAHISKYSSQLEGRHHIKVKAVGRSGLLVDADIELESWVKCSRSARLAVLGDPGSGKTSLLRKLCHTLSKQAQFIPVFISAGQLRKLRPTSREELLTFADPPVPNTTILDINNVIIIIDGLDELIEPASHKQELYSETLEAIGRLISPSTRMIISCRSTTFETTNSTVTEALGVKERIPKSNDPTDNAIRMALSSKINPSIDQLELTELTKEQAHTYLIQTVGEDSAANPAATYVIDHLPRVPVILRFLELALPELQYSTGRLDIDELYAVALRAWILRDTAFVNQDVDIIWDQLRTDYALDQLQISDPSFLNRLVHSGLLSRTRWGKYEWSHFSIQDFFLANWLFEEIKSFNANHLAGLDLISSYNVNRFAVPMCRRTLVGSRDDTFVSPVVGSEYSEFLERTGWRRRRGYGTHPSYNAEDGTGYISGIMGIQPEKYVVPVVSNIEKPVCGLSWYDAFAYCLWSGESLPNSSQSQCSSSLPQGLWYWCSNWSDERKAHVALMQPGSIDGRPSQGGANPDFRHSRIALAIVRSSLQDKK